MFCPHCGEKLIDNEQRFCQSCGIDVLTTSKTTDYKPERIQSVPTPKIVYVPVKPHTQLQMGSPGKYSKLCLWLALGSILIGIVSLIIGYNFSRFYYYPYNNILGRLIVSIAMLLSRVGGLTMGVFSRVNSSKAVNFEPFNDTERAGSIFAIFGILINAAGLILSFLGPWSFFRFPYYY